MLGDLLKEAASAYVRKDLATAERCCKAALDVDSSNAEAAQAAHTMSKKTKVDEGETQAHCEAIQNVQKKIETIEEEFDAKVLELQAEFNKRKDPLYLERNTFIEKLPNFWFQAFAHHRGLELMLHPNDEDIFKYVSSLIVEEKEDIKSGFKISLVLKENPYIVEKELWKVLTFTEANETDISQSGVTWKPGKNPGAADSNAQVGSKRDNSGDSFFSFFEKAKKDDIFAANIIKDDLWPNPLKYYLGEELSDEDEDDFDDDDELDEEDDAEGDEDDGE